MTKNDFIDLIFIVGIILFLFVGVIFLGNMFKEYSCFQTATVLNKTANYSMMTGCIIEYEQGKYIPLKQYIIVEERKVP